MIDKKTFGLLGTTIGHGQPKAGVERAYEYLELVGFWEELAKKYDFRNFLSLKKVEAQEAYNNLFHKTLEIINSGHRPLLIGGDHSQAFASISALHNKYTDLRIIWVDAHADVNTPETSPSGNLHGMPLAGLFGLVDRNLFGMPWMNQLLQPDQVFQLGVRDVDSGEKKLVEENKIENYSPEEIKQKGLTYLLNELSVRWKDFPVHLSFDIDGLDQSLVPATGTPVGNGLDLDQAAEIIDAAKTKFNLVSAEIVEFNPDLAGSPEELATTEKNVKFLIEQILI